MGEQYRVNAPALEGREVMLESRTLGQPRLWVDGQAAQRGAKRGQYLVPTGNAGAVTVAVRPRLLGVDPVPDVEVDGQKVSLAEPLHPAAVVWGVLPLGLLFIGGAIGGLLGGLAAAVNLKLLRSRGGLTAYVLAGLVTLAAVVLFLLIAGSLATLWGPNA